MPAHVLAQLPDTPRWLETRAILRSPHVTVNGGEAGYVARLVHGAISVVAVVGRPSVDAIASAIDGITALTPILAQTDNADHVARSLGDRWTRERVIVHRQTSSPAVERDFGDATVEIRLLTRGDDLDHLPAGLRHEITHAREMAPIAAALVDGRPVSFCYPIWTTESMWDVSIDTLPDHRRRGLAAHATRFMIEHMRRDGLEPIWAALETNVPSLRLAARLGFTPVDENIAFSRGPWAFLSGGFID